MLTTTETQAAMYLYTCVSTQMTLDGTTMLASGSASVFVTVKGQYNILLYDSIKIKGFFHTLYHVMHVQSV